LIVKHMINRILLVEDDDDDALLFSDAMDEIPESLICERAHDGREAILILEANLPLPDVIFLDLNMPGMNGAEFIKQVKETASFDQIPIVVLSTSKLDSMNPIDARVSRFITKPDNLATLVRELQKILFEVKVRVR